MGKLCNKCGMESERDDICTWCKADLREEQAAPEQPASAPPAAPPGAPPPGQPPRQAAPARPTPPAPPVATATAPQPSREVWLIPVIAVVAGIVVLIVALLLVGMAASGPPAEPGEWKTFTSKDNSFSAYYPEGWGEPSNSGSAGSYVLVEWKGSKLCRVKVQGASKAGTIGDVAAAKERTAGGALGGGELPIEKTADGALLDFFKSTGTFAPKRPGYEEGGPQFAYSFANTRSAYVEYTYTKRVGIMPIKMKGMRWAHQAGDYGYHVTAEAPEKHWDEFKQIAENIVGYVQLGSGG